MEIGRKRSFLIYSYKNYFRMYCLSARQVVTSFGPPTSVHIYFHLFSPKARTFNFVRPSGDIWKSIYPVDHPASTIYHPTVKLTFCSCSLLKHSSHLPTFQHAISYLVISLILLHRSLYESIKTFILKPIPLRCYHAAKGFLYLLESHFSKILTLYTNKNNNHIVS